MNASNLLHRSPATGNNGASPFSLFVALFHSLFATWSWLECIAETIKSWSTIFLGIVLFPKEFVSDSDGNLDSFSGGKKIQRNSHQRFKFPSESDSNSIGMPFALQRMPKSSLFPSKWDTIFVVYIISNLLLTDNDESYFSFFPKFKKFFFSL